VTHEWRKVGAYTVRVRVEAPLINCPFCGASLEIDEACEVESWIVPTYRSDREPIRCRRIVRAALCTGCEFCQEIK
jgi:hypothetical protein